MSSIIIQGDTSGSITVEAPSVAGTHTLTLPKATGNIATDATVGLGTKNRIINGDMRIDQRNAGSSYTVPNGSSYSLDRWQQYFTVTASSGTGTVQQVTDAPPNATHSLKFTVTTTATSGAANLYRIRQRLEGFNTADLGFGTINAKAVTLSFWVKSSLTGTFSVSLSDTSFTTNYVGTYTISSANTWEKKTINISGKTTGTWSTDNTNSMTVVFDLGSGSNYQTASINAWNSSSDTAATGQVQLIETSSATWQVSLVQLELGENATPFEHRMYSQELAMCQRYYYKWSNESIYSGITSGIAGFSGSDAYGMFRYPQIMRASPQISNSALSTFRVYGNSGLAAAATKLNWQESTTSLVSINTAASGMSSTGSYLLSAYNQSVGNCYIEFDSEL